jgi:hypothetical protein
VENQDEGRRRRDKQGVARRGGDGDHGKSGSKPSCLCAGLSQMAQAGECKQADDYTGRDRTPGQVLGQNSTKIHRSATSLCG